MKEVYKRDCNSKIVAITVTSEKAIAWQAGSALHTPVDTREGNSVKVANSTYHSKHKARAR